MTPAVAHVADVVRAKFNFTVDKFRLSGPDGMTTPFFGLFRSDTATVVGSGSVSDRYTPHTTDDVLALVDAASEAFGNEMQIQCHFRDGHYVSIAPSKEYRRSIFGTADNIFARVVINAGYDGKAFKASMGYYRDACLNLSIMRTISQTTVSIRHTSKLRGRMQELIATFETLKESWSTLTDLATSMQSRQVNLVNFLNAVYPQPESDASPRAVTIHRNRTEEIFRRLRRERQATGRPVIGNDWNVSAWEAYNAVQGYVQHVATRKSSYNNDFDRVLLAYRDPAVLRAEELAVAA